ncbi:MAG TPA: methylmalonyl-CoA epimerase [Actinocrinis sp.]
MDETAAFTRIDHIGIACRDLSASIEFYRSTFGFEVYHQEENEQQGVREAMLRINGTDDGGATYLQLLEPLREDSAVGKFLAKNGEGVHHIAFGTADVVGGTESAVATGVRALYPEPRHGTFGSCINFLHPKDCHGVLTELVQAPEAEHGAGHSPDSAGTH